MRLGLVLAASAPFAVVALLHKHNQHMDYVQVAKSELQTKAQALSAATPNTQPERGPCAGCARAAVQLQAAIRSALVVKKILL